VLTDVPRSRSKQDRKTEARRLRRLRDALGLTQRELAAEFKVAHGAIAAWESGKRTLPGPVVKLLELYEEELSLGDDGGLAKLKTTPLARSFVLTKAAGSVLGRMAAATFGRMVAGDARAGAIARRTQVAVAHNMVEALGELKGVAMKVGQTFAAWDFAIPDATHDELRTLLTSSRPMTAAAIAQVFLEELGAPPRQLFAEWSPQPFAAASIGQVHRARLRSGEEVAVKVQYPAIVDAVSADLKSATLVDRLAALLFRGREPGVFLDELRERFLEECDYRLEAENQEAFRRLWLARPGVRIPRVHPELSTRRVLVTELVHGEGFESFVSSASRAEKVARPRRSGGSRWSRCSATSASTPTCTRGTSCSRAATSCSWTSGASSARRRSSSRSGAASRAPCSSATASRRARRSSPCACCSIRRATTSTTTRAC
jgi:transcriptional regulator with XRE-family HTH domain